VRMCCGSPPVPARACTDCVLNVRLRCQCEFVWDCVGRRMVGVPLDKKAGAVNWEALECYQLRWRRTRLLSSGRRDGAAALAEPPAARGSWRSPTSQSLFLNPALAPKWEQGP
jgi:hypothetical protein